MIRSFWQSKFTMGIMLALTIGVAGTVLIYRQEEVFFNPIVAALLVLGMGCLSAFMLGNIVASKQYARVLRTLHTDLDPEAFIRAFEHIPEKIKPNSRNRVVADSYLADGYAAAGQFDRAMEVLGAPCTLKGKDSSALIGVYYCAMSRYALFSGDLEAADSAMESLDYVINRRCGENARLQYNMQEVYTLLQNLKKAIVGEEVNVKWLREQLNRASYRIRALEILWVLATDALNRGDEKAADRYLTKMKKDGGKTYFHAWAVERQNEL